LEEGVVIMAAYKLGPHLRYLVEKMAESELGIHEVLTKLASQLASIERKVDDNTADLSRVHEQVNLAMTSISQVQEEQALVTKQMKGTTGSTPTPEGAGIMGVVPGERLHLPQSVPGHHRHHHLHHRQIGCSTPIR
jgi:CII-binding regulator of phage lambda lysogenization HflD